jgi:molybdate/tungstate transport system substrate-binding protein
LLIGASILVTSAAQAAKAHDVEYQGINQGSYGLARQLEGRLLQADVFVPITPGPIDILKKAGMIGSAVPVASTEMVIGYNPKSKFVPDFEAAAQGKKIGTGRCRPPV